MTTDNASHDARQPTVGERLRQAREVAGLSVTEVADRQHLRPAIISAIESGDYGRIDSELFLKGYVRTYATHVGIDPESVIRQLDKELEPLRQEQKARVEASPLVDIERRKRRKRRIAKVVFSLMVLAVVFYGASLYLADSNLMDSPAGESTEAATEEGADESTEELPVANAEDEGALAAGQSVVDTQAASIDEASAPVEAPIGEDVSDTSATDGSSPVNDDNEPGPSVDEAPGGSNGGEGTSMLSGQGTEELSPQAVSDPEPQVTSTPLPEDEPSTAVDREGRLVMEFSDDCWVEVQDSNGRTLVAELRRAGDTLDVTGESPLRVVIGAVSAVAAVRYSGQPVDLAGRRARNDRLVLNLSD